MKDRVRKIIESMLEEAYTRGVPIKDEIEFILKDSPTLTKVYGAGQAFATVQWAEKLQKMLDNAAQSMACSVCKNEDWRDCDCNNG